jgi:ubiquinone/menaquinone biosynthesis C-methylase UbiE
MLRKARKYSTQYRVNPILIRADASCLPVQSAKVDLVYSTAVLIHVPKQKVRDVIHEIARLLKRGGSTVLEESFVGWLNADGLQTKVITGLLSSCLKPAWVRTYTYQEIHRLFTNGVDFTAVDIRAEGYTVLPKGFLTYTFPKFIKVPFNSVNESISSRCRLKNLFVSGWSVRGQK